LWSFLVNIWLFLFIFVTILDSQSRNSRGVSLSPRIYATTRNRKSRETSPLTDFGNHFIAHSLLARNWTRPRVIRCNIRLSLDQLLCRHNYFRIVSQPREILHRLWFTTENNDFYDKIYFLVILVQTYSSLNICIMWKIDGNYKLLNEKYLLFVFFRDTYDVWIHA